MAGERKTIWIVDDSPTVMQVLKIKSKGLPVDYVEHKTPDGAISALGNKDVVQPDKIISDYNIEGNGDGMRVVAAAKEKGIPTILISATANVENEAKKVGVTFLQKDGSHIPKLLEEVKKMLPAASLQTAPSR
jgi:DNA-binding NtrC family response regulator